MKRFVIKRPMVIPRRVPMMILSGISLSFSSIFYDKIAENEAHGRAQKAVQGTAEHLTHDKVTRDGRYRYKDDL